MKYKWLVLSFLTFFSGFVFANDENLQLEIQKLQQQTKVLQKQLDALQTRLIKQSATKKLPQSSTSKNNLKSVQKEYHSAENKRFHKGAVSIHSLNNHPKTPGFCPTALISENQVITYIAGTPVVTSLYLGDRPAFDGSDYIVNISSINRDVRLMQQRRRLYNAYQSLGYPPPQRPIISLSGKVEPVASFNKPELGNSSGDLNMGSSELDVSVTLNKNVEAFMAIAYDDSPPVWGGQRLANSAFNLNMGFVNIGNLNESPFYFTAGQLYAPYGRYSSAMISSPITMLLARTKTRPLIFGYKSQLESGPFAAGYVFHSDTTLGGAAVGGVNLGYIYNSGDSIMEVGIGMLGNLADSEGMQNTGSAAFTTFGGFGSPTNGNEAVHKIPGLNIHGNISYDRYSVTAEWVGASKAFNAQDLSFNGRGAKPQAGQIEAGITFKTFGKPTSLAASYQWSKETLALNLPRRRISGVYNISIWKDTVESLEFRHDLDFGANQFANGTSASGFVNANTVGTGQHSNTLIAQIGVYF